MIADVELWWLTAVVWGVVCSALGAGVALRLMAVHMRHRLLRRRLMRAWQRETELKRELEVEQARRAQDLEAYHRRVDRWARYAIELQDAAVNLGLIAPWRAALDRQRMPFVDSDAAPL